VIAAEPRGGRPADSRAPRGFDSGSVRDAVEAGGDRRRRVRGRFEIVCSGCGQQSVAPFEPDPTRPVYCDACFKMKQEERKLTGSRS
jgi:CxxC-x17-CxxC domain-containing protein